MRQWRNPARAVGLCIFVMALAALACDFSTTVPEDTSVPVYEEPSPDETVSGEQAVVTRVIDGDTIDVEIDGVGYRVRYIGINTPEDDEACYEDATWANRMLVEGQTVTLVQDVSETDQYGRLLRYVYVSDVMINEALVAEGWAEAVTYEPDSAYAEWFQELELAAAAESLGCHPTGIFDDGSLTR